MGELLRVENLRTYFFTEAGVVKAVDDVSFVVNEGEPLGLVGESGSGKTVTVLSAMGIVTKPGRIVSGKIFFRGQELDHASENEMRKIRGKKIGYVSQDPNSSLDPLYTIGNQLQEVIRTHFEVSKDEGWDRGIKLLKLVGIPEAETRMKSFPHELSGGMRQRVAIARALAGEPELLVADEPTTNLDVTIQAQVLELLKTLEKDLQMSLILITHDMGLIAEMTDRVVVLYAGKVAEEASTHELFQTPRHPYSAALLNSVPRLDRKAALVPIGGGIPNLITPPNGCRFHPRCAFTKQVCMDQIPPLEDIGGRRAVSCHRWKEIELRRNV
ncbi:MAG: ABC transporter ATP-binding protein [Thaumarchaeota archaeon]|nr:ABC transporter ATP-binding protein [Nitrososphaerota archaeon]